MSARWQKILDRFPTHLEAARPGKQLQAVAEPLAGPLDALSTAMARVRRAHRLSDAEELIDLLRTGALHGVTRAELAVAFRRFERGRELLEAAAGDDAAAVDLMRLWGLAEPGDGLERYAIDDPPDAAATRARLVGHARKALARDVLLDAIRARIGAIAAIHARGNGTVTAVARGAANAIDCDVESIGHSTDRYIHWARVRDRQRLSFPLLEEEGETDAIFEPAPEMLVIEENPLERVETPYEPRTHAETFQLIRRGFERVPLRVRIRGTADRTVGPMIVNRDEGHGLGYFGTVADGSTLEFTEEGRALLDGQDGTARAYAWKGACFADSVRLDRRRDFAFDADRSKLVEELPAGSLAASFVFPHAGDNLPPLGIETGTNRFAFFVQEGHYSRVLADDSIRRVEPRPAVGFLDQSVFGVEPGGERPTAAHVSLAWLERCAFRARIWIPRRFRRLTPDDPDGLATRQQVLDAVARFRPAGVRFDVDFLDPRWVLGRGVIYGEDEGVLEHEAPGMGMELSNADEGNG